MVTNNYFELRWSGATITRRYTMVLPDATPGFQLNLNGISENIDGAVLEVRLAFKPRQVQGQVFIAENQTITEPRGTRAELAAAWAANDLEAKLWEDAAFWPAVWLGDWEATHLDPMLTYWVVPIRLRQREP